MRRGLTALAVAALAAASVTLSTGTASAADSYSHVTNNRSNTGGSAWYPQMGSCYAQLDTAYDETRGYWVARAEFHSTGDHCTGRLERSTDGGNTWKRVSNGSAWSSGWHKTGWYWDGNGDFTVMERAAVTHPAENGINYTAPW